MTTRTRILVTNDDGIDAPGLRWLARAAAREGHDVVVAAPITEASGSSAAMTAVEQDVLEREIAVRGSGCGPGGEKRRPASS